MLSRRLLCRFGTASLLLVALCVLAACGPSQTVTDVDPDTKTDYSGRWNESDAKRVADKMIGSMLESAWLQRWTDENEDRPTVIIGPIRNKTMQHIDEEIFIKEIERTLVNSDTVQFTAAKDVRQAIRHERQKGVTRCCMGQGGSWLSEMAQDKGADILVLGTISSTVQDSLSESKAIIFYTVTLELLDLETNAKVWLSEKEIKKTVDQERLTSSPRSSDDGNCATTGRSQGC